jgi:hypothetical protein
VVGWTADCRGASARAPVSVATLSTRFHHQQQETESVRAAAFVYRCMYACMCACVCMCVWGGGGGVWLAVRIFYMSVCDCLWSLSL